MEKLSLPFRVLGAEVWLPERAEEKAPMAPMPRALPRRMGRLSRAVLSCVSRLAEKLGAEVLQYPVVYASRYGEIARTLKLFEELTEYGEVSPAGFSVSVHNAAASLLGLASANCNSSSTLAAGADTLRMGVLEAVMNARTQPCLFVYGDEQQMEQECVQAVAAVIVADAQLRPLPQTIDELLQLC